MILFPSVPCSSVCQDLCQTSQAKTLECGKVQGPFQSLQLCCFQEVVPRILPQSGLCEDRGRNSGRLNLPLLAMGDSHLGAQVISEHMQKYLDTRPLASGPEAGLGPGGLLLQSVRACCWGGCGQEELLQLGRGEEGERLGPSTLRDTGHHMPADYALARARDPKELGNAENKLMSTKLPNTIIPQKAKLVTQESRSGCCLLISL